MIRKKGKKKATRKKKGGAGGSSPQFVVDREIRALVPPLWPDERVQLEESLLAEGCREALVVWDTGKAKGILLDGHHRYEMCRRHKLPYRVHHIKMDSRDAAKVWVLENQLGRRNLNVAQRVELALKLKPLLRAQTRESQRTSTGGSRPQLIPELGEAEHPRRAAPPFRRVDKEIAKIAGVSHGTVQKTERVLAEADEETKAKLRRGETTINREYSRLHAKAKPPAPKRTRERPELIDFKTYKPERLSAARIKSVIAFRVKLENRGETKLAGVIDDLLKHARWQDDQITELKKRCRYV